MADSNPSLVERLFGEHRAALQSFFRRRIRSRADVDRLIAAGVSCFLVGEFLLRQPDIGATVRGLLAPAS